MAVAVLVVNFRVYDDLDRSLTSLQSFLNEDDEVIVVDNASDPDRGAWVASRHPRVRIVPMEENIGFSAAVNVAAKQSSKPYLLLLNPDTMMLGPVVRVLETWLKDHPDTAVAGPQVLNADGSVQPSARRFPGISAAIGGRSTWLTRHFPNNWISRRNLLGRTSATPVDVDWLAGSCFMTSRQAFRLAGGLDEGFFLYWEDADYCRRLKGLGFKTTYVPTVSVRHLGGHSAELVPELAVRAFHDSVLRLHVKHGGMIARMVSPLARVAMRARTAWRLRIAGAGSR